MQLKVLISSSPAFRGNSPFWGIFATTFLPLLVFTILGQVQFKIWKCFHRFQGLLIQISAVLCLADCGVHSGCLKLQSPWKYVFFCGDNWGPLGRMMGVLSGKKATAQVKKIHCYLRYLGAHSSCGQALLCTPAFQLLLDVLEKPAVHRSCTHGCFTAPSHQNPDPRTISGHKKYTFKETRRDGSPTWLAL